MTDDAANDPSPLNFNIDNKNLISDSKCTRSLTKKGGVSPETDSLKCDCKHKNFSFTFLQTLSGPDPKPELPGAQRTYRVWLDSNQYQQDMAGTAAGGEDVYESFNIIMRRKPKENNFKVSYLQIWEGSLRCID